MVFIAWVAATADNLAQDTLQWNGVELQKNRKALATMLMKGWLAAALE